MAEVRHDVRHYSEWNASGNSRTRGAAISDEEAKTRRLRDRSKGTVITEEICLPSIHGDRDISGLTIGDVHFLYLRSSLPLL